MNGIDQLYERMFPAPNFLLSCYDVSTITSNTSHRALKRSREYNTITTAATHSVLPNNNNNNNNDSSNALQVIPIDIESLRKKGTHAAHTAPQPHIPWKLTRVLCSHTALIYSIDVDHENEFFVSGSLDRTIKVWNLASGALKVTLTGHVQGVTGVRVSQRQPYLFSSGEDNTIKCWDLSHGNAVKWNYHGHLGGVFSIDLHSDLDIIASGGSDGTVRLWDIRSRACVYTFHGHKGAVTTVRMQNSEPQLVSCGIDGSVRMWDLVAGKAHDDGIRIVHKKSVTTCTIHPVEYSCVTGSADSIRKWKFPDLKQTQTFDKPSGIAGDDTCHDCCVNGDGVFVTGHGSGMLRFYDWGSGTLFQKAQLIPQPGSAEGEAGARAVCFDRSGSRLLVGMLDKSIQMWREEK